MPPMQKAFQFTPLLFSVPGPEASCQPCIYLIVFTYTVIASRRFECQLITLMGLVRQCLQSCCTNKHGAVISYNLMAYLLQ